MKANLSDILKQAIIMEARGKSLYQKVAEQTENEDVKKIFNIMAEEEQTHIEFLSKQLVSYKNKEKFDKYDIESKQHDEETVNSILTKEITEKISGAGFEAAAISAAIDMENKSIEVYSEQAKKATDPNAKELFEWLANWEKGHHKLLTELNKQLTEKVWYDNSFWPF